MPDVHDAIIVGGGPAGCGAALHASRLGLRVLLLERKKFPRDKLCGDALSSTSIALLEELGLLGELLHAPHMAVSQITYVAPSGNSVTVPLAKVDKDTPVTGIICRRVILDDLLLHAAAGRADVVDWCEVTGILMEEGRPVGVKAERGGGRISHHRAQVVIGADGFSSLVAKTMGVPRYPRWRSFAARAYYRYVLGMTGCLEVHYFEDILPGYLWIYPTESGLTNVGLTIPVQGLVHKRIEPRRALQRLLRTERLRDRFEFAEELEPLRTAILPVGNTMRQVHGDGFMLVGDAAGLVNPCSSEGVANALLSGKLAATVLAKALDQGGDVDRKGLMPYADQLWRGVGPGLKMSDRLLELRTPKAIDSLIRSARRRPHNAAWISGILVGSALPSEDLSAFLGYIDFFSR